VGKPSRDKGARFEREIVKRFNDSDIPAQRVPLSGAAGGSFCGDIKLSTPMGLRLIECKKRARGFTQLYGWIEGNDLLVVARDRSEPLVVLTLADYISMLTKEIPNDTGTEGQS